MPVWSIADNTARGSLASRMRRSRFSLFLGLIDQLPPPINILDIGGTASYWKMMDYVDHDGVEIIILNIDIHDTGDAGIFRHVVCNACDLGAFPDNSFDVVYSNSVIEHVGTPNDQFRMAVEVQRVGRRHFIQTPNRYFPIEPHFLLPFFQFLPVAVRAQFARRLDLGWVGRIPDPVAARKFVENTRLLGRRRFSSLFPRSTIVAEKLGPLTKSLISVQGWADVPKSV